MVEAYHARVRLQRRRVYVMDQASRSSWLKAWLFPGTRQLAADRAAPVMAPDLTPLEQGRVMVVWPSGKSTTEIHDTIV